MTTTIQTSANKNSNGFNKSNKEQKKIEALCLFFLNKHYINSWIAWLNFQMLDKVQPDNRISPGHLRIAAVWIELNMAQQVH